MTEVEMIEEEKFLGTEWLRLKCPIPLYVGTMGFEYFRKLE